MPKNHPELTADRLCELLSYCPETGEFRWKVYRCPNARAGDVAGNLCPRGYIKIKIDKKLYRAHRLAWLFVRGCWPDDELDHRNGIRCDNRIDNLRAATHAQNHQNRAPDRGNKSRRLGVSWSRRSEKWCAHICVNREKKYLGAFDCPEKASEAYAAAKAVLHKYQPRARGVQL